MFNIFKYSFKVTIKGLKFKKASLFLKSIYKGFLKNLKSYVLNMESYWIAVLNYFGFFFKHWFYTCLYRITDVG